MHLIEAKEIHKSFDSLEVLKGINLTVNKEEVVSIVGASGAGKTTLLQILGSLDSPTSGNVYIDSVCLNDLSDKELSKFRNKKLGFVFQFHQLLPEFNALENVILPALIGNEPKNIAEKRAKELLSFLNLSHRLTHKPKELSGGEKQRVAVARALINNPILVLADEPTGNLDSQNRDELHELIFSIRKEFGCTFVIVSHDDQLSKICDKTFHIKDGVISQD